MHQSSQDILITQQTLNSGSWKRTAILVGLATRNLARIAVGTALVLASTQNVARSQNPLVRIGTDVCGEEPNAASRQASTSGNGTLVAFTSSATNLVSADTNGANDVFMYDANANTTYLVSSLASGTQGNHDSDSPSIDGAGDRVAFSSLATNFVSGTSGRQVFLWTRTAGTNTGTFTLVSHNLTGGSGNGTSAGPSISADGAWVAFYSFATDLVTGDTNGHADAFVYEVATGTITRVSVGNGPLLVQGNGDSYPRDISTSPDISVTTGDRGGVLVAFQSMASNLVANDFNGKRDVFLRDVNAATTTLVSVNLSGTSGHGDSSGPDISRYARYVAFLSDADDLIASDTNAWTDVFVRDLATSTTTRVSVSSSGAQGVGPGATPAYEFMPTISYSGLFVAFDSDLKSLVSPQPFLKEEVFLRDTSAGTTTAASVDTSLKPGNDDSRGNALAQDDSISGVPTVSLQSAATDLIYADLNGVVDVFTAGTPPTYTNYCFGDGTGTACPCGNTGSLGRGCENAQSTGGAALYAYGIASLSNDSLGLQADYLPPATEILFFQGTLQWPAATGLGVQFGDGLRCVGGVITRLATKTAAGSATYSSCLGDTPVHTQGNVTTSGTTYYYQGWYRQAVMYCTGATFNLTNGVSVVWAP